MSSLFFEKLTDACHDLLLKDNSIYGYLTNRGLKDETIRSYKLGAFPKDLRYLFKYVHPEELKKQNIIWQADKSPFKLFPVVIPIRNVEGQSIAIGCRTLLDDTKRDELGIPKYRNSNYSKTSYLFGLDKAFSYIREMDQVFVVEGYFDVITAHQNGMMNVVATCGTMFSYRQLAVLARYTNNVCLLFDNDAAGRSSAKRVLDKLNYTNMDISLSCKFTPDGFKDLDEYLVKGGSLEFLLGNGGYNINA